MFWASTQAVTVGAVHGRRDEPLRTFEPLPDRRVQVAEPFSDTAVAGLELDPLCRRR